MNRFYFESKALDKLRGLSFALLFIFSTFVSSNSFPEETKEEPAGEVVVYSPHGKEMQDDIKAKFEAKYPKLKVHIQDMGGAQVLMRLRGEKNKPACDVWWGGSPADFRAAGSEELLKPYTPDWTKDLSDDAKSPNGFWHAMYLTPEVIMFNENKIKKEEVPTTWDALIDPKWKGKIVIRDVRPSATMRTIFGSFIWKAKAESGSEEAGFDFLRQLHENTGAYAPNPNIMYDLLLGENEYCLTPWNLADALLQKHHYKKPFGFVVPKDTPVPVEPIALIDNAPNVENGRIFYDFVTSKEMLIHQAKAWHRLPARKNLPKEDLPEWMKSLEIQPLDLDWEALQKNQDAWIDRWYREIKSEGNASDSKMSLLIAGCIFLIAVVYLLARRRAD